MEQGKTIIVNFDLHKKLSLMKIEGDYKSIDDLIIKLVEEHEKKEKAKNGKK